MEDYDPRFLKAHQMADGNLYKLKDGIFDGNKLRRNQGLFAVTTDEDFQNIRMRLRPTQPAAWLDANVAYEKWYPYHTVVEAVRHYDVQPADTHSKNRAWYFEPMEGSKLGRLWTLPYDSDASWGPNWNEGVDYSTQAIATGADKLRFRIAYRNFIREFRDLLWRDDVINPVIDDLADVIRDFVPADRDRWRNAPPAEGTQDYGTLEAKVADMKRFAFVGWTGSTGPAVPAGGRAKYLDTLASAEGDATRIPVTPVIRSAGPPTFPLDRLTFETDPFQDPQNDAFGAMEWRLGEVNPPGAVVGLGTRILEWHAVWRSGELTEFENRIDVPLGPVLEGRTYRARVRMKDATGRWSHWSAPVEFTAGPSEGPLPQLALRITEVMYNPAAAGDLEFIEVTNTGAVAADLSAVRVEGGIQFAFAGSGVTSLGPGEAAVVVKDLALFSSTYDATAMRVAGEYAGRLSNSGDSVALLLGSGMEIVRVDYDDGWYPPTDGDGYSLVPVDPAGPIGALAGKDGWRASAMPGGSPGRVDPAPGGLRTPGDLNGDGRLGVSDAIGLLGHLFRGRPAELPCGGDVGAAGNRMLLDANGDGALDLQDPVHLLSYLFLDGPPHVLGTRCAPVPGCAAACGG